ERLKDRKAPKKATQAPLPGIDGFAIKQALEQMAAERTAILAGSGDTLDAAMHTQEAFEALEHAEASLRNRLRAAADFWCAQWFGEGEDGLADSNGPVVPSSVADFASIAEALVAG